MLDVYIITKDYWIARWLKKPNKKDIKHGESNIKNRGMEIKIGISNSIVEKIINIYNENNKKCFMYGRNNNDFDIICSKLELSKPIVILVLKNKNLIKKDNDKNE